jgi:hypothetical protein
MLPTRLLFGAASLFMLAASVPASADTLARPFEATLAYDRAAPAEAAYADLERQARKACAVPGKRALREQKAAAECAADLLERAIARIANTELARLHESAARG